MSRLSLALPLMLAALLTTRSGAAAPTGGLSKADRLHIQAAIVEGRDRIALRRLDTRLPRGGWCDAHVADTPRRAVWAAFHADLGVLARRAGRVPDAIACGYRALDRAGAPQLAAALYEVARLIGASSPGELGSMQAAYAKRLDPFESWVDADRPQPDFERCRFHVVPATWGVGCLLKRARGTFDRSTVRHIRAEIVRMAVRLAPRPVYVRELARLRLPLPTWSSPRACKTTAPHGVCIVEPRIFADPATAEAALRHMPADMDWGEAGQKRRVVLRRVPLGETRTGRWQRIEFERGLHPSEAPCRMTDIDDLLVYTAVETGQTRVYNLGRIPPERCGSGGWGDSVESSWGAFDGDAVWYVHDREKLMAKNTVFEFGRTVDRTWCQAGPDGVPICVATSHTIRTMRASDGLSEAEGINPSNGRFDRQAALGGAPRLRLIQGRLNVGPVAAGYMHPQFGVLNGLTLAEAAARLPDVEAAIDEALGASGR